MKMIRINNLIINLNLVKEIEIEKERIIFRYRDDRMRIFNKAVLNEYSLGKLKEILLSSFDSNSCDIRLIK